MSQLFQKPFLATAGFIKRLWKGFPAFYAQPDLQQYFDSIEHNLLSHSRLTLGDVSSTISIGAASSWNPGKSVYNLVLEQNAEMVIDFYKFKVSFPVNHFSYSNSFSFNGNDSGVSPRSSMVNVWLVATKRVVTFAEDSQKSGITGPTIQTPLESSDVEEYHNFSLTSTVGDTVPTTLLGQDVLVCVAQFSFYFDTYWKPIIINNGRTQETGFGNVNSGNFPIIGKVLSPYGYLDYFKKIFNALNSTALRRDGSNRATADLYQTNSQGTYKFITEKDNATTSVKGVVRFSTVDEAKDETNNSTSLTPFALYKALGTKRKIIPLGSWDMSSDDSINIPHGLSSAEYSKAFPSGVYVFSDSGIKHNLFSLGAGKVFFGHRRSHTDRAR